MALPAGIRLGPYEVLAPIGVGGMGEVYRARDPRLARDVAIKVLAPQLAQDRDALARFEREAKTASALNHPHIVHIYEIGEAQTPSGLVHYIAMELVEGETLRTRLKAGARIKTLLEPLAQAADALARAHKAGIVHRDLKPENVMISADGYPKVLDFGLAKLHEPAGDPESQPTPVLAGRTRTGTVLGTPGYMSPEQVHGEPADHRSDIFSFGCILYEATTGRQPFRGATSVATLHAIVYDKPPAIESISPETPEELGRIIRKCLEKAPDQRYQAIKDAADDLRAVARAANPSLESTPTRALPGATGGTRRQALRWPLLLGAAVAALVLSRRVTLFLTINRNAIQVEKLTSRGDVGALAVSPDGRYLAYTTGAVPPAVWLRDLVEKTEARLVTLAESERVSSTGFARDGRSVYYYSSNPRASTERQLYRVPLIGGEPRLVSSSSVALAPDERRTAFGRRQNGKWILFIGELETGHEKAVGEFDGGLLAWSADASKLLFSRDGRRSLFVLKADGTADRKVGQSTDENGVAKWKPDGTAAVLTRRAADGKVRLVGLDLASGATMTLGGDALSEISDINWLPDGSGIVFIGREAERSVIWHVSYPKGKAARIPAGTAEYASLGMTADGRLVANQTSERSDLVVSSSPEAGAFKKIVSGTDVDYSLCWTADGQIVYASNDAGSYDLYASDPDGARRKQLTFDRNANETAPAASPDGRYIVFVTDRSGRLGIDRINRDGTGLVSLTSPTTRKGDHAPHVTPDSRWVFYRGWDNGPTLWKVSIDGGTPTLVVGARTEAREEKAFGVSVSPDGASLAFFNFALDRARNEFSPTQLAISTIEGRIVKKLPYATLLTAVGDHQRVQWSRDGATLYYHQLGKPANLWKRPVTGGAPVQVTRFEDSLMDFEWSPDGKTLACSRQSSVSDAVLITNFR